VAGDVKMQVYREGFEAAGVQKVLFHTWFHSQFMLDPPDEMAGSMRKLSNEESKLLNLPPGTYSLLFSEHEIDGVATDVRHIHFPSGFQFEIFFTTTDLAGKSSCYCVLAKDER
jgi:hypothetical protein